MNTTLYDHVMTEMRTATEFVCRNMPVNIAPELAYEDLLGDSKMAAAFKEAVKYLQPSTLHKRVTVEVGGRVLAMNLRFPVTEKYPMYLMPASTAAVALTPESALAQALATPIRVASDWMALTRAFDRMNDNVEPEIMALLFPWMVPLIEKWAEDNPKPYGWNPRARRAKQRTEIDREVVKITRGKVPSSFPTLTSKLNNLFISGRALFAQYRMLEASYRAADLVTPIITIDRAQSLTPDWVDEHLSMVISDWKDDELVRRDDEFNRIRRK